MNAQREHMIVIPMQSALTLMDPTPALARRVTKAMDTLARVSNIHYHPLYKN